MVVHSSQHESAVPSPAKQAKHGSREISLLVCWLQLLGLLRGLKAEREAGISAPDLAEALSARGYLVRLESGQPRECGKSCGRQCLEKLQHTYLIVSGSLDSAVTVGTALCPASSSGRISLHGEHFCSGAFGTGSVWHRASSHRQLMTAVLCLHDLVQHCESCVFGALLRSM